MSRELQNRVVPTIPVTLTHYCQPSNHYTYRLTSPANHRQTQCQHRHSRIVNNMQLSQFEFNPLTPTVAIWVQL